MALGRVGSPGPQTRTVFAIAAWCALGFGLLEGTVLAVARHWPAVLGPLQVSADILWVAPIVHLAVNLFAAMLWLGILALAGKRLAGRAVPLTWLAFSCLGSTVILDTLRVFHPAAALLLGIGLPVAVSRRLSFPTRVPSAQSLALIPAMILLLGAAVVGADAWSERQRIRSLGSPPDGAPNILVLMLDTVRKDRMEGPDFARLAPRLAALSQRGVRYTNAWSTTSWSLPSQASMLTGAYPHQHRGDWPLPGLDPNRPTLAEFLTGHGYVTGAFSSNASWTVPEHLGRGFARFRVYSLENLVRRTTVGRRSERLLGAVGLHAAGRGRPADQLHMDLRRSLGRYPDRPYFAYLCYMDVNAAMHRVWLNRFFWTRKPSTAAIVAGYEAGLTRLDSAIGGLLDSLAAAGSLDNTIIVITSDHGESFGAGYANDRDPSGHGTSLYGEQLQIPLFIVWDGRVAGGDSVAEAVSLRDLAGTLVKEAGLSDTAFGGTRLPLRVREHGAQLPPAVPLLATLNYDSRRWRAVIDGVVHFVERETDTGLVEEVFDWTRDASGADRLTTGDPRLPQLRSALAALLSDQTPPPRSPPDPRP